MTSARASAFHTSRACISMMESLLLSSSYSFSFSLSRYYSSGEVDNGVGDDDNDIGKCLAAGVEKRDDGDGGWTGAIMVAVFPHKRSNKWGLRVCDERFSGTRFSRILYLFKPLVCGRLGGEGTGGQRGEMRGNGRMVALIVLVVTAESDFHPVLFLHLSSSHTFSFSLSLSFFSLSLSTFCTLCPPSPFTSSRSFAAVKIARADCWTNNSRNERISLAQASLWDGIYILFLFLFFFFHSSSEPRVEERLPVSRRVSFLLAYECTSADINRGERANL